MPGRPQGRLWPASQLLLNRCFQVADAERGLAPAARRGSSPPASAGGHLKKNVRIQKGLRARREVSMKFGTEAAVIEGRDSGFPDR